MERITKFFILYLFLSVNFVLASEPKLNFTDLVNGPSSGLGDGLGSGAIVTLWGQNLGSDKSDSKVIFTDVNGTEHAVAHVYYWKNADGVKPSGVANLFKSHRMQEIAFSIPNAPLGQGTIHLTANGISSNKLPFLVRTGKIYHIKSNGDDESDGSFSSPFLSLPKVVKELSGAGSIIYLHDDLRTEDLTTPITVYWNKRSASSGYDNHYGIIAYPDSQPRVIGVWGFGNFNTKGMLISKIKVLASNCEESLDGQPINCFGGKSMPIQGTNEGRIVANALSDIEGGCAVGEVGAIWGDNKGVQGLKIYGNEIYEFGCPGTSKFMHTTYINIRSLAGISIDPWEFGWNYLHDNKAKNGIHNFDLANGSSGLCGTANDTVKIHDNVIVNQAGAGIYVGASCEWSNDFEIYNNLVINAGLPADWNNVDPNTSKDPNTSAIVIQDYRNFQSKVHVLNNSIIGWNSKKVNKGGGACISILGGGNTALAEVDVNSNLCVAMNDGRYFFEEFKDSIFKKNVSSNNAWFNEGDEFTSALAKPDIGGDVYLNLGVNLTDITYSVNSASALIQGSNTSLEFDLYGNKRGIFPTIGSIEYRFVPLPPSNLSIK